MKARKFIRWSIVILLVAAGFGLANNNFPRTTSSRAEFEAALNRSYLAASDWMLAQPRQPNTFLNQMIQNCANLSGDLRLAKFVERSFQLDPDPYSARLINPSAPFVVPTADYVADTSNYQRWLLHAISRKEFQLSEADRAEMFDPDKHRTGRATHQLYSLAVYREFNGTTPELDALIRRISERIAQEAALDFRVTDLYLQRIAFLLFAGQSDLVHPRWVERALAAQETSGGWRFSWYGWNPTPYKFDIEEEENVHATAQGMWLSCLVKYRYPQWIADNFK